MDLVVGADVGGLTKKTAKYGVFQNMGAYDFKMYFPTWNCPVNGGKLRVEISQETKKG